MTGVFLDDREKMSLPRYITHYYEADRGPFLNICDQEEPEIARIYEQERKATTAFNRFALGDDFMTWRRAADDMLLRAYTERFGVPPQHRPYYAVLGNFDRTLTMFRAGRKIELDLESFREHELTFMYPDHSHLTQHYELDVPHLFYQRPEGRMDGAFWGRLFTFHELREEYETSGIAGLIEQHLERNGWAGSYVEAHIWCRDERTNNRRADRA